MSDMVALTYTRPLVRLQGVPDVTPAYGTVLCVLAGVLAASIAMVTSYCRGQQHASMSKIISATFEASCMFF